MILGLKRAIAEFIETGITDVKCFASENANKHKLYPCIYITELERKEKVFGAGLTDYIKRTFLNNSNNSNSSNTLNKAQSKGKIIEYHTTFRFVINAVGNSNESEGEQAHRIDKELNQLFINAVHGEEKVRFIDSKNMKDMNVTGINFVNALDIPELADMEPLIFRRAITYKFIHRFYFEKPVEYTIDDIQITQGGKIV